jgi:hypothetical protein
VTGCYKGYVFRLAQRLKINRDAVTQRCFCWADARFVGKRDESVRTFESCSAVLVPGAER